MKKLLIAAASILLVAGPVLATGSHTGGHGHKKTHEHSAMAIGMPGNPAMVSRTIKIAMTETDDGEMLFAPESLSVTRGETVRFSVANAGEIEHEFVLHDHAGIMKHKRMMEKMNEGLVMHKHDDPNSVSLQPDQRGEIVWQFTNGGTFEFACLIPGHYEAGMKGVLEVAAK